MPDISPDQLALGFIWYIAFLFSTTCHEAAHALVANLGGDPTAASGGQVTLNPVPHIQREPWGMVVIPILSFIVARSMIGWASAPYDPLWERRHPRRAALMALAGPTTNYLLMFIAVIGFRLGTAMQWLGSDPATGRRDFPSVVLLVFFTLNLLLGTFNLLPTPPRSGPYLPIWPQRIWFIAELLPITAMYGSLKRCAVSISQAVMPNEPSP